MPLNARRFLISCELTRPKADYTRLLELLKSLEAVRVMDSQWVVRLEDRTTCRSVRNHFKDFVAVDDRLLIAMLDGTADWAGWNLDGEIGPAPGETDAVR